MLIQRVTSRIGLVLLLLMSTAGWAVETRISGYEPNDPFLEVVAVGSKTSIAVVKAGVSGAPFSSEGDYLLKISWSDKQSPNVAVTHLWPKTKFAVEENQRLLVDIYIPDVSKPSHAYIKDKILGEHWAQNRIETNQWIPFEFEINANPTLEFSQITKLGLSGITAESGSIYIDNLRLLNFTPAIREILGEEKRIDIVWEPIRVKGLDGYNIYRKAAGAEKFSKISAGLYDLNVYSDFLNQNGLAYTYKITSVVRGEESNPSASATATSKAMDQEEFLTSVQRGCFRFFWDLGHPTSGLTREGYPHRKDACTSGGTGMGIMNIVVGVERGFVTRQAAARRILTMLAFLEDKAVRHHGVWPHWMNGLTGKTIPFGHKDNGGDIVETAYLVEGILTARQYFNRDNPIETAIRKRATSLWEQVEWDWYRRDPDSPYIYWHWSPDYHWDKNHPIRGFNECMITYILAIASPTHPVPASCYHDGWAQGGNDRYVNGKVFYGHTLEVGKDYAGPLFFTHYSYLGFDPRHIRDQYCNYFENNKKMALIHQAYCIDNPKGFTGYNEKCWGLTASTTPAYRGHWGYMAHSPYRRDNGTITPTAAISSMPYTPKESMAALNYFYHELGPNLWGAFGFYDAFNLTETPDWYSFTWLSIDQGTIVPMIENYRTQLCWNLFMSSPEIKPALDAIGFTSDSARK